MKTRSYLNFSCREQPADIVTEEAAIPGGACQVPSARKRRRMETESTERTSEVAMFDSTLKLGFESLSGAMRPVQDVAEVERQSVSEIIRTAQQFEQILEMFERATKKAKESTGRVKAYYELLCNRLNAQLDEVA
jgi:hypothetical protein